MRKQLAGKHFLTIKRDPRELATVVIQKSGCQADAALCRNIGQGCIMVRTVEIVNLSGRNQTVLHTAKRRWGAAPDHQADRDIILVFCAEILPLLDGPLQFLAHIGKVCHELSAGRRKRCSFSVPVKESKADLKKDPWQRRGFGSRRSITT